LFLWGRPGAVALLAGHVLVFDAFLTRRERSLRGTRPTMFRVSLARPGLAVGGALAAAARHGWLAAVAFILGAGWLPLILLRIAASHRRRSTPSGASHSPESYLRGTANHKAET